jgi:hypothetical protein
MDETEDLIIGVVREARKAKENMDITDRVKAADAALRFMTIKHKLVPEKEESDFERELRELHDGPEDRA